MMFMIFMISYQHKINKKGCTIIVQALLTFIFPNFPYLSVVLHCFIMFSAEVHSLEKVSVPGEGIYLKMKAEGQHYSVEKQ